VKNHPIYVTKPSLPPLEELYPVLKGIWDRGILTNSGPLHDELEKTLCDYLDAPYISLYSNGTTALLAALSTLELKAGSEVITTPFTFIATANAIIWNQLTPVFVDIDPVTLNISPQQIEAAVTPKTRAILGVHVFGVPCDIDAIQDIAERHSLFVVYDAAHAFGVQCHCGSILQHGDLSTLSFHATKVFNTFEGGAVVCKEEAMKAKLDTFKNFGLEHEGVADQLGINAKMSEFNAAVGLLQLGRIDEDIEKRRLVAVEYQKALQGIKTLVPLAHCGPLVQKRNYSYFPIQISSGSATSRDEVVNSLGADGVFARRYFYPLVNQFQSVARASRVGPLDLTNAETAAANIICLPIYPDLNETDIQKVVQSLKKALVM